MVINVEPGTIPQIVVYGAITTSDLSGVYLNGAASSLTATVSSLDGAVSFIRLQQAINAGDIVQLFVSNSPGSGDVLDVTFVGNPATTASITNVESQNLKLEEKLYEMQQKVIQLEQSLQRVSQQLYQQGR